MKLISQLYGLGEMPDTIKVKAKDGVTDLYFVMDKQKRGWSHTEQPLHGEMQGDYSVFSSFVFPFED